MELSFTQIGKSGQCRNQEVGLGHINFEMSIIVKYLGLGFWFWCR